MNILITGGAGFIGSHACSLFDSKDFNLSVIDNLSNSNVTVINNINSLLKKNVKFFLIDLTNINDLDKIFSKINPDLVIHFAGKKSVSESILNPLEYFNCNIQGTINLLKVMNKNNCKKIIFSSSASIYGMPKYLPIDENHPICPLTPYSKTKYFIEEILKDWSNINLERGVLSLRYFNPIGNHPSGIIGENSKSNFDNIFQIISNSLFEKSSFVNIFGDDYDTIDGTGVRDYVHVMDLASAHRSGVDFLQNYSGFIPINLGTGIGTSVKQLIDVFSSVSGHKITYLIKDKRKGDISSSFANFSQAKEKLGWRINYTLENACKHRLVRLRKFNNI